MEVPVHSAMRTDIRDMAVGYAAQFKEYGAGNSNRSFCGGSVSEFMDRLSVLAGSDRVDRARVHPKEKAFLL